MPIDRRNASLVIPFGDLFARVGGARVSFTFHRYVGHPGYVCIHIKEADAVLERQAQVIMEPDEWQQFVSIVNEVSNELGHAGGVILAEPVPTTTVEPVSPLVQKALAQKRLELGQ